MKRFALLSACGLLMAWNAMATNHFQAAVFVRQEPIKSASAATSTDGAKPESFLKIEDNPTVGDHYLSANESCEITTIDSNPNCVQFNAFSSTTWSSSSCIIKFTGKTVTMASNQKELDKNSEAFLYSLGCKLNGNSDLFVYLLWDESNTPSSVWNPNAKIKDELIFNAGIKDPDSQKTPLEWHICFTQSNNDPSDCNTDQTRLSSV